MSFAAPDVQYLQSAVRAAMPWVTGATRLQSLKAGACFERKYPLTQNFRVGFWQNGFFAKLFVGPPDFYGADFVAGFLLLIFVGKSVGFQGFIPWDPTLTFPFFTLISPYDY